MAVAVPVDTFGMLRCGFVVFPANAALTQLGHASVESMPGTPVEALFAQYRRARMLQSMHVETTHAYSSSDACT